MSLEWQIGLAVLGFWAVLVLGALAVWVAVVRPIRACERLWEGTP